MNILFLSLFDMESIDGRGLYSDLLREIAGRGHAVFCVSASEKLDNTASRLTHRENAVILQVASGSIQKTGLIKKGVNTLLIGPRIIKAIKRRLGGEKFDLVLYPTPPVTFAGVVRYIKKRDGAASYLMLKDIFPQGAVDIGLIKDGSIIHRFFRRKEKKLYAGADYIGCMSEANARYLTEHNPDVPPSKVEVCPNSASPGTAAPGDKAGFRKKYKIPDEAVVFMYGGNLGRPQDIAFIIKCLEYNKNRANRYFIICGDGTEFNKLKDFVDREKPRNITLSRGLPRDEYDAVKACCDAGLIFLDHRFTIPNFPSRLLSYLESAMPVLACTDASTDMGKVITENGFGWWCESADPDGFTTLVDKIVLQKNQIGEMGLAGRKFLEDNYTAAKSADIILNHF